MSQTSEALAKFEETACLRARLGKVTLKGNLLPSRAQRAPREGAGSPPNSAIFPGPTSGLSQIPRHQEFGDSTARETAARQFVISCRDAGQFPGGQAGICIDFFGIDAQQVGTILPGHRHQEAQYKTLAKAG